MVVRRDEKQIYYGRRHIKEEINCLIKQKSFFDEEVHECKYVLGQFCFEYMSSLSRCLSCDLNRTTPDCIVPWK